MNAIKWHVKRSADGRGYEGIIILPDRLGHQVKVSATAHEKDKALSRASAIANKALDNPAVQALLPPGAGPALKTMARLASSPTARRALRRLRRFF